MWGGRCMKRKSKKILNSMFKKGSRPIKLILLGAVTFLLSTGTAYGTLRFPVVSLERSTDGIIDSYTDYLKFALEVGRESDRESAQKLVKIFEVLKKKNPRGAALFLKGLRFEMVQKIELMGIEPSEISSSNAIMKRWVGKYMKEWVREADEHLFRSQSASKAELALSE